MTEGEEDRNPGIAARITHPVTGIVKASAVVQLPPSLAFSEEGCNAPRGGRDYSNAGRRLRRARAGDLFRMLQGVRFARNCGRWGRGCAKLRRFAVPGRTIFASGKRSGPPEADRNQGALH